jgi:hypothetical protein
MWQTPWKLNASKLFRFCFITTQLGKLSLCYKISLLTLATNLCRKSEFFCAVLMCWREKCIGERVQNLMLLLDSSPTSQRLSYMNKSHKMAASVVSLVSRTKQFTTYFHLVQWPSDLLSAVDELSHVPFHSGHSLWGKIFYAAPAIRTLSCCLPELACCLF